MPPFSLDPFAHALLDLSLAGTVLFRPVYGAQQRITDFIYDYVNPTAQLMLRLPARPVGTVLELRPHTVASGVLGFLCQAFQSDVISYYGVDYQAEGLDAYYQLAARRYGDQLLVSFSDTADRQRGALEVALRESQAREQERAQQLEVAQATTEREQALLRTLLMQAPVAIGLFQEPDLRITAANAHLTAMWGRTPEQTLGLPLLQAVPELQGQGFDDLIRQVLTTQVPFVGNEVAATMLRDGQEQTTYYNFIYQPLHDANGAVLGVIDVAVKVTEQVEARQELRQLTQQLEERVRERTHQLDEQQQLLGQILRQVPAAIATLSGSDHCFVFANARYQDLVGHRATVGQTVAEALPEVIEQGVIELLDRVYHTGEPFIGREIAIMLEQPPGPAHHYAYDLTYLPLRDGQDQVQGILVFAVDVTEQVRMRRQAATLQAALLTATQQQAQARETFYQVFEQTPAAICIQRGPEHRFEYVNAAYQQYFPSRDLLGKIVREAVPETVNNGLLALLDQVYATGETYSAYEQAVLLHQPDGSAKQEYVTFTYQAYRENGEIVGVSTFVYNVAAQVTARRAREAQQQLLATVFDQSPVGIWVAHGADHVLDFVNPAMTHIMGRSPAQVLGQPYFEVMTELVGQGLPELFRQVWERGETILTEELPVHLAHYAPGQVGYFTFTVAPLRDEHGQVSGLSCVSVDVTSQVLARQQVQMLNEELAATNAALRAANAELHTSNAQLTRTNVDLDTFIYTASHDLKAPITNIEGLLAALRYQLPATVQQEQVTEQLLAMMQGAVERFQATISQLTDISRLQYAQNQPAEQLQLAAVIRDVQLDLQPLLLRTRAQLTVDVGLEVQVLFAPKNLRSVVYNLLSNALKYHQPDQRPVVRLQATTTDSHVVLEVQDQGLGLNDAQQKRLFGLFQRLHAHVEGTGVGLYMVKRVVENASGTIAVQSQEGVGTTFTVTFPTGRTP